LFSLEALPGRRDEVPVQLIAATMQATPGPAVNPEKRQKRGAFPAVFDLCPGDPHHLVKSHGLSGLFRIDRATISLIFSIFCATLKE
jgi:hypothetical protein